MKIKLQNSVFFCSFFFASLAISFSSFSQEKKMEAGANMGNLQNTVFLRNLVSQGITEFRKQD